MSPEVRQSVIPQMAAIYQNQYQEQELLREKNKSGSAPSPEPARPNPDRTVNDPPNPDISAVRLKIQRRSSHPWVFQKMVEKPAARVPPGSVVDVLDREGQWVGRGFYNGHSRISLRILTADPDEAVDDAFFARRIDHAVRLRRD